MPFSSAYGNGPSSLPGPVPDNMTLAGLQESAAIPAKTRVPAMRAPAAAQNAPQAAPAQAGAAQGLSPEEQAAMGDYDKLSPEEKTALNDLSANPPTSPGFIQRLKNHVRSHWGELAGGTGAAMLTGGNPVAAGAGAALGEKLQAYVEGQPDPSLGQSLKTGALNAAGAFIAPGLAKWASGAESGFAKGVATAGAQAGAAQAAQEAAAPYVSSAQKIGAPVTAAQTAPGTVLGAQAEQEGMAIAAGQRGIRPQQDLMALQMAQEQAIQKSLGDMKELFPAVYNRQAPNGEALGHLDTELKPHEFAQDWLDRYHGMLDTHKTVAREVFKDRQFDISNLVNNIELSLKKNFIIDDAGRPIPGAHLASDEQQLFNLWKTLGRATTRQTAFGARNQVIPGLEDSGNGPFMATAGANALPPGSPGAMGTLNMTRQPQMMPGDVPAEIHLLPPNSAGDVRAGVDFTTLDNVVSRIQNLSAAATDSANKSAMTRDWQDLSKAATTAFHDVLRDNLAPVAPESAQMISRLDAMYSKYVDGVRNLSDQIQKTPSAAAKVFVDKYEPENTKMAFHILTGDQAQVVRREIVADSFRKALDGPTGRANAANMASELRSYGDKNLDIVLGPEKEDMLKGLDAMAQLQRSQIDPRAAEKLLTRVEISASKSKMFRQGIEVFSNFFNKNKPLQDYLGSPDFMDRVVRRGKLFDSVVGKSASAISRVGEGLETVVKPETAPAIVSGVEMLSNGGNENK